MKIAVAANSNQSDATVDPHFGRCHWYCIYDSLSNQMTFIENPVYINKDKVGCDAADFLIEMGISIAIAGRFGSKVVETFRLKKIQMIIPEKQQTVYEIINQIK
jgi:predicted Fe-Mo cluster-binding NifX family protein